MNEKTIPLSLEKTLDAVRKQVFNNEGKILKEEKTKLLVEHGDWETSFNLVPQNSKTRVVTETKMKTSHKALFGIVFVGVIISSFFIWFGVSTLRSYVAGQQSSLSGWFNELLGYSGFQEILAIVGLLELMGYFIIILGIILGITVTFLYYRKESFTEKVLMLLPQ